MHKRLLPLLACPKCHADLRLETDEAGERIEAGTLVCAGCATRLPIVGGIPRLLPEGLAVAERRTVSAFANEWGSFDHHPEVDAASFWSYCLPLVGPEDFTGRTVLDVGCGAGRHLGIVAGQGAAHVVGLDLSASVEVAAERTRHLDNVDVVQGSALALPFKPVFDLAYSVGVLHHLPNPGAGFLSMARAVAPNGRALAWVYGREGNGLVVHLFDPFRRHVSSRLPFAANRALASVLAPALWLIADRVYPAAEAVVPPLRGRLPLGGYLAYLRAIGRPFTYWIVLDQMIPTLTHYISRREFEDWFRRAGLAEVRILPRSGNSWRGVGRRATA
jgi:SAM-dependent methyltransferase